MVGGSRVPILFHFFRDVSSWNILERRKVVESKIQRPGETTWTIANSTRFTLKDFVV